MKKAAKNGLNVNMEGIQRYHQGGRRDNPEAYASAGYENGKFYLYTSDRKIEIDTTTGKRVDGRPVNGYGLEIESTCDGVLSDDMWVKIFNAMVAPVFPRGLFKAQSDGSLGGRSSAEFITQPITKEGIRNMYRAFQAMFDGFFPAFNASSGHVSCGMHINISSALFGDDKAHQDEAIRKLYYFINKNFILACHLFRRNPQHTNYCGRMDYTEARTMDLSGHGSDHYVCINLGHYDAGRIELRIVGGQPSFQAFRNTMETCFHLVARAKTIDWDKIDDMNAWFRGCNQYVYDRLSRACNAGAFVRETFDKIARTVKTEDYEITP